MSSCVTIRALSLAAVCLTWVSFVDPAYATERVVTKVTTVVESVPAANGQVDWTRGEITATGIGARPDNMSSARARIMAREAAVVVAERNLVKIVHGIHISSETTVREAVLESDTVRRSVDGFIKGARLISEQELGDGSYQVTMALPLFGQKQSLASSVGLGERTGAVSASASEEPQARATQEVDNPGPVSSATPEEPVRASAELAAVSALYSGLLVDCRGLHIERSMSPKILDAEKREVWGTVKVSPDLVNEKGIVGYYKSIDQAKSMRLGNNPLVVKATAKAGPRLYPSDPIICSADAELIKAEDGRCHFLDRLAVGFLVD